MKLSDWVNEYRNLSADDVTRPVAEPDDWNGQDLFAPADRMRDNTPRWRERAQQAWGGRRLQP